MGRLDLLDVRRDEDEPEVCQGCGEWNRGTHDVFGARVCGRASCLGAAQARAGLAAVLVSDDPALD